MESNSNSSKWVGLAVVLLIIVVVGGLTSWYLANRPDTVPAQDTTGTNTTAPVETAPENEGTPQSEVNQVEISDFAYSPQIVTIKKGTTVTWTNKDSVGHTVTFNDSSVPSSNTLNKNATYSHTFDTVGTFTYFCEPHPQMKGTVEVTE